MRLSLVLILMCVLAGCGGKPPGVQRNEALRAAEQALLAGDIEQALVHIDAAIAIEPSGAHLHQMKGNILFHASRYSDAVESYNKASRLEPRNAEASIGAAFALKMMNRDDEAAGRLDLAEQLFTERLANPKDSERFSKEYLENAAIHAKLHLALIAAMRGERASAVSQVDRIAGSHPGWESAAYWQHAIRNDAIDQLITGQIE